MKRTKEQAVLSALAEAEFKNIEGLLLKSNEPNTSKLMGKTTDLGDYETVHSIAALYADDRDNDGTWEDAIEDALMEKYPTHF